MKNENIGNFEEKSYTECPLYKKMTEGRYPWGSDEDKILKYCANDVAIIAEQMAREKQKDLEDKADKYEKILVDICDALDPHFDFDKYDDVMEAFENFPSRILDLKRSWKDNFDECIRKMDIIDELKAENSKLKEEIKALKSDIDYKDTQLGVMRLGRRKDDKRWNDLNKNFWFPLCDKLYGTTRVNKTYEVILSDISDLKDRADGNYKASIRKDELIQDYREKLKKANDEINLLNSKFDKLGEYYRTDEKLIDNIQKVIFPQEEGSDYTYSYDEILNKVKDLKVQSDENGTMYEDLKDKYEKLDTHYRYDEDIIKDIQDVVSPEDNSIWSHSEIVYEVKKLKKRFDENETMYEEITKLKNENISLNTINKGLADDLRAAKDKLNYLYFKAKEFANKEESDNE